MKIPTIISELTTDPTIEELQTPTIRVPELGEKAGEVKPDEIQPNIDDFEPEPQPPDIIEEKQPVAQMQIEKPQKPEKVKMSAGISAAIIVDFEDNLQQIILPPLYQRAIFTPEEKKQIRTLKSTKLNDARYKMTEAEARLWEKYQDFKDLKNLLPFEPEEKKTLEDCWSEIIKANPLYGLSPVQAILMAHAAIFSTRVAPLLSKLTL